MTFREYYDHFRTGRTTEGLSYDEICMSDTCNEFLFPGYAGEEEIAYTPFNFNDDTTSGIHGGDFAKNVSRYIFTNCEDMMVMKSLTRDTEYSYHPIQQYLINILKEYKYKWHAYYESMLVDGDYDMLDNVNEYTTDETIRKPDLDTTTDETFDRGAVAGQEGFLRGQRSSHDGGNVEYNSLPYDDSSNLHLQNKDVSSNSHTENESSDERTYSENARHDAGTTVKSETGTETTTYERRRHGNIGVTTSGQLIRDFRLTHDIDLVKIVANDIIERIFTGAWC